MVQLRAFLALAQHRHFGSAARALGIAQPTLSQTLAALEDCLGVQLIERSSRSFIVTPAGERLLPFAERAVASVDAVVEAAAPDRAWLAGPLSVGIIPTVGPYVLPTLLRALRRDAPDLAPVIMEDQTSRLLTGVRAGDIDVAILATPVDEGALVERPLYDEDFVVAVPAGHALGGREGITPQALDGIPLLLLDEGHCLRDQAIAASRSSGAQGVDSHAGRAASLSTVVQLVDAGMGITLLPDSAAAVELRRTSVEVGRFAAPAPGRRIVLVYRGTSARAEEYDDLARILRGALSAAKLPVRVAAST